MPSRKERRAGRSEALSCSFPIRRLRSHALYWLPRPIGPEKGEIDAEAPSRAVNPLRRSCQDRRSFGGKRNLVVGNCGQIAGAVGKRIETSTESL